MLAMAAGARASELRETPIVKAVQQVRPSVVNIRGEKVVAATAAGVAKGEMGRRVNGMGTGIVIDSRGYILTNFHVVDGVHEIQVTTAEDEHFIAKVLCHDPETDLAIIKIQPERPMTVITIGSSADLMPGESVIAIGNAYGYVDTVTQGIVSALHRAVQVSDAQYYEDLIQTDACINPGNSGGPLLNIDGEMIGINVAVRAGAQGIGFAIPADRAMAVAADLLNSVNVRLVRHGILAAKSPGSKPQGLAVGTVEKGSPAAEAGILPGDLITAAGETAVQRPLDFQRALLETSAGQQLALTVRRGQETLHLPLKLAEAAPRSASWELLGLEMKAIPADEFRQQFQTQYRGGLVVVAVRNDSPAANQGIRRGDVLVGMHVWETISLENVAYILNRPDFNAISPIKFFILRGNETLYGYLPVATLKTAQR
jgi:serine protease Do